MAYRFQDPGPEAALRVDPVSFARHGCDRDVGEALVPEANDHVRPTRHRRMHGVLAQQEAEFGVQGVRRETADQVAGVDVAHGAGDFPLRQMGQDSFSQEEE